MATIGSIYAEQKRREEFKSSVDPLVEGVREAQRNLVNWYEERHHADRLRITQLEQELADARAWRRAS